MRPASERGAALLTVLLLVALMSALAVALLDDIRFGLRRTANAEALAQARWYALGAETFAAQQIRRLAGAPAARAGDWSGQARRFPVEGGLIVATVRDGSTCFNLNSVVQGAGEQLQRRDLGVAQFMALLAALRVSPAEAQAAAGALVDWIDSDDLREPAGAEDEAYLVGARPYRTAGALLAEVSELRAVRGVTPELYARLRPHVCALPTAELSPINVNALRPEAAVLVTMLTDGRVAPERARRALAQRPAGGWTDAAAFWASDALADAAPEGEAYLQVATEPRFFALSTEVAYVDAEVTASAFFERDRSGEVRLIARRWGPEE